MRIYSLFLALGYTAILLAQEPPVPGGLTVSSNQPIVPLVMAVGPTYRAMLPSLTAEQEQSLEVCAAAENLKLGTNRWTGKTYYAQAVLAPTRARHQELLAGIVRQAKDSEDDTGEVIIIKDPAKRKKLRDFLNSP